MWLGRGRQGQTARSGGRAHGWCPSLHGVMLVVQLKQSGWIGNYALGCSYISLPWWCGQAMFGTLTLPVVVLTVLYR